MNAYRATALVGLLFWLLPNGSVWAALQPAGLLGPASPAAQIQFQDRPHRLVQDPTSGTMYAALAVNNLVHQDSGWEVWKLRLGSPTWELSERFSLAPGIANNADLIAGSFSEPFDMAVSARGEIYVVGASRDATGRTHAVVTKSERDGRLFRPVLSFGNGPDAVAHTVAVEGDRVFVGGMHQDQTRGESIARWVLHRSLDGGRTWSEVDPFARQPALPSFSRAILINGNRIIVAGSTKNPRSVDQGFVRFSDQNGDPGTWQSMPPFEIAPGRPTTLTALTRSASGDFHAIAQEGNGLSIAAVTVNLSRRTFKVLKLFSEPQAVVDTFFRASAESSNGRWSITLNVARSSGRPLTFWQVHESRDGGTTWSKTEENAGLLGQVARSFSIFFDRDNRLWVGSSEMRENPNRRLGFNTMFGFTHKE